MQHAVTRHVTTPENTRTHASTHAQPPHTHTGSHPHLTHLLVPGRLACVALVLQRDHAVLQDVELRLVLKLQGVKQSLMGGLQLRPLHRKVLLCCALGRGLALLGLLQELSMLRVHGAQLLLHGRHFGSLHAVLLLKRLVLLQQLGDLRGH
jgi:hypothetical protein